LKKILYSLFALYRQKQKQQNMLENLYKNAKLSDDNLYARAGRSAHFLITVYD